MEILLPVLPVLPVIGFVYAVCLTTHDLLTSPAYPATDMVSIPAQPNSEMVWPR